MIGVHMTACDQAPNPDAVTVATVSIAAFKAMAEQYPAAAYAVWQQMEEVVRNAPYERISFTNTDEHGWMVSHDGTLHSPDALCVLDVGQRETTATLYPSCSEVGFRYDSSPDCDDLVYLLSGQPVRLPIGWKAVSNG